MIKFKNYNLYIGCQTTLGELIELDVDGFFTCRKDGDFITGNVYSSKDFKLKLRPLSSMTEEERKNLWAVVFSRMNERGRDFNGMTRWIPEKTQLQEPRWVMSQGCERLGIQMNGEVWADCDLHNWKHNPHEVTLFLLKHHFDLFGLLDSGEVIDATKEGI